MMSEMNGSLTQLECCKKSGKLSTPSNWNILRGESIFSLGGGASLQNILLDNNGDCLYLKVSDLNNKTNFNFIKDANLKFNKLDNNVKLFPKGTIIFPKRGAAILINRVKILGCEATIDPNLMALNLKQGIDNKFFMYYLLNYGLYNLIDDAGIPQINNKHLYPLNFIIPPLPEQQKIASILSKVDEQIEQTEQIIEKTELLKKGLMQKLLTKGIGHTKFKRTELGEIPEEWSVGKLGNIAELKNGLNFKKEQKGSVGIPVVDVLNMFGKGIQIETDNLYNVNIELEKDSEYFLKKGDLLFVRSSLKKEGVGWTSLYNGSDTELSFCGFIIRARITIKNVLPIFMTYYFRSDVVRNRIIGSAGQVAITNVNQEMLKSLIIPIPPLDEQQKIASILSKVDSQIQDNQNYLTKLQELKKGLMQDLLTGKVRVCI